MGTVGEDLVGSSILTLLGDMEVSRGLINILVLSTNHEGLGVP